MRNKSVFDAYFSHLSRQTVLHGAGVIKLFQQQAADAVVNKEYPAHLVKFDTPKLTLPLISLTGEGYKIIKTAKSFFAQVGSATNNVFSKTKSFLSSLFQNNQNFQPAGQVSLDTNIEQNTNQQNNLLQNSKKDTSKRISVATEPTTIKNQPIIEEDEENQPTTQKPKIQEKAQTPTSTVQQNLQQTTSFKECNFSTNQSPSHSKLIINEVAWMGMPVSANDEWIELKNISGGELNLNGWQLIDQGEQIKINLGLINKTKIPAGGFVLLERTDDNSVPGITADGIYSGALSNNSEGLRLFDGQCSLIDEVLANPDWPAGDNTSATDRKTMERNANDFNWHTSSAITGTPKAENSTPSVVSSGGGGGGVSSNNTQQQTTDNSQQQTKILISEIKTSPTAERFIELYNPNNTEVNLTDWYLQRKTQTGSEFSSLVSKTYFEGKVIPANGYLLISRSVSADSDIIVSDITLTESNTIQLKNSNQEVVDKVGWGSVSDFKGSGPASSPASGQSIQRKFQNNVFMDTDNNANDFEIQTCPSPKAQSRTCQTASSQTPNYILISEIKIKGDNANDEFIEFYNPTDNTISLGDYSIQYLSGTATSTDKISSSGTKKNFPNSAQIPAKGFYLTVNSNATSSLKDKADMTYSSFSLSGNSSGATIFLVSTTTPISNIDDSIITDSVSYGNPILSVGAVVSTVPDVNKSLERKSLSNNICISAQSDGEFLGNGCDTDSAADFEIRNTSNPQNSQSFPEPRNAPTAPLGFNIQYSTSTMELIFNWQSSQDYSGVTSTITYKVNDISQASSSPAIAETSSTTAKFAINEVGRDYNFSIQAFDKEGFGSETATSTITVPSFLKEIYFYQDPRYATSSKYLLEFTYNNYPFLPDARLSHMSDWPAGDNWKAMVFYLNQDALKDEFMHGDAASSSQSLSVQYQQCSGYHSSFSALILPDSGRCWPWTRSIESSHLEDNRFLSEEIILPSQNVSSSDYISVAYYGFYRTYPQGSDPSFAFNSFKLIAVDKIKYHFQNEPPVHQAPTPPSDVQLSFNDNTSDLALSFLPTTDPDTVDKLITYQFNYTTSSEAVFDTEHWQATAFVNPTYYGTTFEVVYNNSYLVGARAMDNLGNFSLATTTWSFPENFLVIKEQRNTGPQFNANPSAVAQVFVPDHSGYAKGLQIINQGFFNRPQGTIQAFLYDTDNPNNVSSSNLLATSEQKVVFGTDISRTPNPKIKNTLSFQEHPFLEAGHTYLWMEALGNVSSNLEGVCEDVGVGGSGWARFSSGWYSSNENCDSGSAAAKNYYFVLIGSTSP